MFATSKEQNALNLQTVITYSTKDAVVKLFYMTTCNIRAIRIYT